MLRSLATAVLLVGTVSAAGAAQFSNSSIQKFDSIKLLLDNRKALKIDDRQRAELDSLRVPVKWNIKKLAARIDSAQRNVEGGRTGMRGGRGGGTSDEPPLSLEETRARMIAARKVIQDALVELQREHDSTGANALSILNEAQRPHATALLKKRGDELLKMIQEAGFGSSLQRGGGPGGGPLDPLDTLDVQRTAS